MSQNIFIDPLKNLPSYKQLIDKISEGVSPISLYGLSEENMGHISFGINKHGGKQILLITENEVRAKKIYEDLKTFNSEKVELFPSRELVLYDIDAYSHETTNERIRILNRLLNEKDLIVVTHIEAVLSKIMSYEIFKKYKSIFRYGETIDLDKVIKNFIVQGYERVSMVEGKGQFSIRGGIIDFFPPINENPYRIELFDDEIDSIRTFDIKNQRSIEMMEEAYISPNMEIIIEDEYRDVVIKNLKADLENMDKHFEKKKLNIERERLNEKFNKYIYEIQSGNSISNIDMIIPYIPDDKLSSIIDFIDEEGVIFLDEPRRIKERVEDFKKEFSNKYIDIFGKGEILKRHSDIFFDYDRLVKKIIDRICITSTSLMKSDPTYKPKAMLNFTTKGSISFHNNMELLVEELEHYKYRGYKTIIFSGTIERGERLKEVLMDKGIECSLILEPCREIKSSQIYIVSGSINRGFEYPTIKFSLISDKEIFGSYKKKARKKPLKKGEEIESFTDLNIGDFIVHENYGIGQYVGVEQLDIQGIRKDYLTIKYQGNDKLFVPIDQMNLIQKYIGSDSVKPKINKLGGSEWIKTKAKARKAIEDMAKSLIQLYAKRERVKGFAFSKDTPWQKQFEDLFPYEETQAQLKCVEEIKKDMENDKPMDRLLCGDVGYGKTEVALRAVFKAIMDGKQVAFLVPTTILAQQHYNTIIERFSGFPINIGMLSRFKTQTEQKKVIDELRSGNVDIVVGTHRLLSKDVKFKDLGLLIVDEEQRFGVKHKETLKKLKENIDVLTLTATPIPRTLHMSLVGIRDMSIIDEPPGERYPIETYVVEYNEELVRDAIIREIGRDGQVYFVFNRVEGIEKMAIKLKQLVPEARITVAHGQMSERELERVMIKFLDREYDVLVCTTIIETGLDIPNVNTIIIYNSDKMGLSQLYQLRGRVGRSNRIAFSYFTYEKNKALSEVAEKRLKAIKEFTEFGSGFKIAMRDLEIRGAGNLLGAEQHGHMAAIGYDLYVKILSDSIKRLRGEEVEESVETTIDINVDGYVPKNYIQDEELKIETYKKIAAIQTKEDYSDVLEELIDRFGDVPDEIINLMKISHIKYMSSMCGINSINQKGRYIELEFRNISNIPLELLKNLSEEYGRRITFDVSKNPSFKYRYKKDVLEELEILVEEIKSFISKSNNV